MDDEQASLELEHRVDKLTKEAVMLRKEVAYMKAAIKQQNIMIRELMKRPKTSRRAVECTELLRFPIASQQELDDFEKSINGDNMDTVIEEVRSLIRPKGIERSIEYILSGPLCMDYNLDGVQQKKRLNDYHALMNILYRAAEPGLSRDDFNELVRLGLKRVKGRHYKNLSMEKKKRALEGETNHRSGHDRTRKKFKVES